MANKVFKKVISGVLATASAFACVAMFSGCETNYPKVQMEIEFNGKSYTLNYNLNRKVAPTTVAHFLHLAGTGYYDGLCVHDFSSSKWVTGGYSYTNGKLVEKDYFAAVRGIELTHTVWYDADRTDRLAVLDDGLDLYLSAYGSVSDDRCLCAADEIFRKWVTMLGKGQCHNNTTLTYFDILHHSQLHYVLLSFCRMLHCKEPFFDFLFFHFLKFRYCADYYER